MYANDQFSFVRPDFEVFIVYKIQEGFVFVNVYRKRVSNVGSFIQRIRFDFVITVITLLEILFVLEFVFWGSSHLGKNMEATYKAGMSRIQIFLFVFCGVSKHSLVKAYKLQFRSVPNLFGKLNKCILEKVVVASSTLNDAVKPNSTFDVLDFYAL